MRVRECSTPAGWPLRQRRSTRSYHGQPRNGSYPATEEPFRCKRPVQMTNPRCSAVVTTAMTCRGIHDSCAAVYELLHTLRKSRETRNVTNWVSAPTDLPEALECRTINGHSRRRGRRTAGSGHFSLAANSRPRYHEYVDAWLREIYEVGRCAYPDVRLDFETFRDHYAQLATTATAERWQSFASDLLLACACAQGMPEAVSLFERELTPRALQSIRRVNANPEFVEETLQVLRQRLLVGPRAKIREYSARGPLFAWLAVVATRTALDEIRGRRAFPDYQDDLPTRLVDSSGDPELLAIKARYAAPFRRAVLDALSELKAEERNLLRMYLVSRCSLSEIARAYAVHRATAARRLVRARESVFKAVRSQLRLQNGGLTDREFASIARAVQSQLDLDLVACLGSDAAGRGKNKTESSSSDSSWTSK